MEWDRLLSNERLGKEGQPAKDVRSDYQRDYDRIVYSSAFRRLQDKTQVFPLAESDYVRTRLTHSIEVSCVGRSLGTLVGEKVIKRDGKAQVAPQDFGNIVAAACLAHDIGNPPFGHSGEEAIAAWFKGDGRAFTEGLTDGERNDLEYFEGNAQGLRILTRLQNAIDNGGLQLTYATLATFAKYPASSRHMNAEEKSTAVSEKKFNYFQADAATFEQVATSVGLRRKRDDAWCRHPLAFLVEAADDICYRVIDLEDGHRLGRVSFEETERLLKPIAFHNGDKPYYKTVDEEKDRVEYLRAIAINNLIYSAVQVFDKNYEELIVGELEEDLMSLSEFSQNLSEIKSVSRQKVYATPSVLHIEAAGFGILGGLLERVVPAVVDDKPTSPAAKKMRELISPQYLKRSTRYERLLAATDYISGMTDSHALTLYRRLSGIELPRS